MAKIRPLFISEEYNSTGQFMPPNPYGQDVSVGREMQGGDDQDMERDLQADIGAQPIKAFSIEEDKNLIKKTLTDNNQTINTFVKTIAAKLGYSKIRLAGEGTQGYAYDVGNSVILKITSDRTEAAEALKLLGKNNSHIGNFYKVFNLNEPYDFIYVILREKLNIDPKRVALMYKNFRTYMSQFNIGDGDIRQCIKHNDSDEYRNITNAIKSLDTTSNPNKKDILQFGAVIKELFENKIRSIDFNENNFGFKPNGNLAFYDIGYSISTGGENFDLLQLENELLERVISYMPGSKAMNVKKKCQLGGNGNGISTACNQGDINNLLLSNIKEEVDGFHMNDAHEELVNMDMDSALSEERIKFTILYHGTSHASAENIKKYGVKIDQSSGGYFGWGFYTTPDLNLAKENYADFAEDDNELGVILEFKLNPNAKILDLDDPQDFETWRPYSKMISDPNMWKTLIKNGIDGLYDTSFGGVVIYNTKVLSYVKDIEANTIPHTLHEISNEDLLYRKWKRDNVTYRGISDITDQDGENGGMAMLGRGLYSVPASNKTMARKYGKLRILVNAKPKNPKIFNTLNDWEIWFQNNVVFPISKAKGKTYPDGRDVNSITDEMLKRGYDGIIIKGREIVNYKPENVRYYENERQLEMYYDDFVRNNNLNEKIESSSFEEEIKKIIDEVMVNDFSYIPEGKDIKYGSLMLNLDIDGWKKITSIINKDDIYDKPTLGIVNKPHISVFSGFHSEVTFEQVKKIVNLAHDLQKPINIELIDISIFEDDDEEYDVVKLDVKSDDLHEINTALKKLPYTPDFSHYQPHVTISFVKKGTAKKYARKLKKSIKLQSKNLVYSTKDEKKTRLNENREINVNVLPFKSEIEQAGGKIYSVGGAVRDHILQKPSKDLDLLITGLPLDKLEAILSKYGKVDAVGKSFGIIKFNTPKTGELDIAIPRTERATGQGGYQGFDVTSDHELPIEKDLERRDFTINAIAKDAEGNLIDPYHGEEDIKNKVIRMVNPQAFKDDPLRMIRAVQFAARFGFTIEPETLKAIQENASRIKEISPERILIEFDKIVKKGNPVIGAQLLEATGLYGWIFENSTNEDVNINYAELKKVKTMGEFIFLLGYGNIPYDSVSEFYKEKLKGDLDTYNEIRAYELAYKQAKSNDVQTKLNIFGMNKLSPKSLESDIIPHDVKENIGEMKKMGMPFSMKDLQIDGNDLLALGYTGQQIGKLLSDLIVDIYSGKLRNNRELLLRHLTPKIQEV